jgi:hypothetical protein
MYSNQVPRVESQRATELTDQPTVSEAQGDLLVNNLIYKQPKALSLAKTRTHVKQFFQRSNYDSAPNKTAVIDWNTGASYIDVGNSYLSFNIIARAGSTASPTALFDFGDGSAMNVISRITIRTRSGTEVERLEGANLWSKIDTQYSKPKNWRQTIGSAMGMGKASISDPNEVDDRYFYEITPDGETDKVVPLLIPLKELCPFFRPLKGQLLPPQLASGLHIEIVFERTETAIHQDFTTQDDAVLDYDVRDISFLLDTVELSDETQKTLNMESADNGLEWVTPRIYTAITSVPSGQGQVSVQVRKSCSQATMAYSLMQQTDTQNSVFLDSMNSEVWSQYAPKQWQYRIGSLFFPQQPVVDTQLLYPTGSYYEAQYAFDKPKHPYSDSSVTMKNFWLKNSILAMTASKDDDLFLSGLPINNSRVLEFNMEFNPNTGDRVLTTFLEYIQVCKSYVDNTAVAI